MTERAASATATGALARLSDALRHLVRRWSGGRRSPAPPLAHPSLPQVAIFGAATVAVIAADAPGVRLAERLPSGVVRAFRPITELGTSGYILVICVVLALIATVTAGRVASRRARVGLRVLADRAIFVFVVVALSGILAQVAKHIVGRARPRLIDTLGAYHFDLLSIKASLASFPSGHATTAFAAATAIGLFWPRGQSWLLGLASLVAFSRLALTAHYPSDVAAGIVLGLLSTALLGRSFARRRIALDFTAGRLAPRGKGLVLAALRSLFGWRQPAA